MEIIQKYFPDLTPLQLEQFRLLEPAYKEWNEKINVISRKDIDQLYERHVLHSLAIAKVTSFKAGDRIIDAGTGGGFPGIPLAIFFPEARFHLVDSIGKKIKVVNEVAKKLELKNVTAEQARVEELKQKFDYSVSRAVAPLGEMVTWLKPIVTKEMFFLKGGDLEAELAPFKNKATIYPISDFFTESFFEEKKVIQLSR